MRAQLVFEGAAHAAGRAHTVRGGRGSSNLELGRQAHTVGGGGGSSDLIEAGTATGDVSAYAVGGASQTSATETESKPKWI